MPGLLNNDFNLFEVFFDFGFVDFIENFVFIAVSFLIDDFIDSFVFSFDKSFLFDDFTDFSLFKTVDSFFSGYSSKLNLTL